jgi:tetratricopeptide (TPR) repeat protein
VTSGTPNIGPWRLLGVLGEGGMGTVHRAEHAVTGRLAALKVVKRPQEGLLRGIRHEIRALARLRHPGIVQVLDEGVEGGLPWYAMELVPGRSLREIVSRQAAQTSSTAGVTSGTWWTGVLEDATTEEAPRGDGLDPTRALTIVRRLCGPLAYLHGAGIVHRDLKPDNVLLRQGDLPVIVDFGIAAHGMEGGREAVETDAPAAGTAAYSAPEQVRGELVDARADLFALGGILYELLTGLSPSVWPAGAERLDPGVSALLARLLARSARERIGYAVDVARALTDLGAEADPVVGPPPAPYVYRAALAGRSDVLADLRARIADLARGQGGLVLLGGESGVGKTRVLVEIAREASRRGVVVERGAATPAGHALEPFRSVLQRVADRCRTRGEAETERLLGRRLGVLARIEPSLRDLPGAARHPDAPALPPDAERLRTAVDLVDTIRALASTEGAGGRSGSLLLLLDDLHHADATSLEALRLLGRGPVLAVGAWRSEEAGEAVQRLLSAAPSRVLERLDAASVASIVGDMLALDRPPETLCAHLAAWSQGNPFFVSEFLRLAAQEGALRRDEAGRWTLAGTDAAALEALPVPASIADLFRRRLDALDPWSREVAEAAAVLGRQWKLAVLDAAAGADTLEAVEALSLRQVLEPAGPGEWRFSHDRLRDAALARLEPERSRALHRAAAGALEAAGGDPFELGRLREGAGDATAALAAYEAAVVEATARWSFEQVVRAGRAASRIAGKPLPIDVLVGEALGALGRHPEAEALVERIEAECDDPELVTRGRLLAALLANRRGESERTLSVLRPVLAGSPSPENRLLALQRSGTALWRLGRFDEARPLLEASVAIARELGHAVGLGDSLNMLANVIGDLGDLDGCGALYEEALALFRGAGDKLGEARAINNLGATAQLRGDSRGALELHRRALVIRREVGDRSGQAQSVHNLSTALRNLGEWEEAERLAVEGLETMRAIGNGTGVASSLYGLGRARQVRGDLAGAEESFAEGRTVATRIAAWHFDSLCAAQLGALRYAADPAAGEALFVEAIRSSEASRTNESMAVALQTRARARLATRPDDARADAEASRALWSASQNAEEAAPCGVLARVAAIRGDAAEAERWLEQARAASARGNGKELRVRLHCDTAATFALLGRWDDASAAFAEAEREAGGAAGLLDARLRRSPAGEPSPAT